MIASYCVTTCFYVLCPGSARRGPGSSETPGSGRLCCACCVGARGSRPCASTAGAAPFRPAPRRIFDGASSGTGGVAHQCPELLGLSLHHGVHLHASNALHILHRVHKRLLQRLCQSISPYHPDFNSGTESHLLLLLLAQNGDNTLALTLLLPV